FSPGDLSGQRCEAFSFMKSPEQNRSKPCLSQCRAATHHSWPGLNAAPAIQFRRDDSLLPVVTTTGWCFIRPR
ncbi:MAG: hypothetical protein KDA89_05055, partial [Planctomycetaceae bacterium]|nr:hypothetical protein [Planctomycetaceae bacterium]